jgi:hypothetical protein
MKNIDLIAKQEKPRSEKRSLKNIINKKNALNN